MTKRSAVRALTGIVVLGVLAAAVAFLILRTALNYNRETRGVALGVLPAAIPTRSSGLPFGVNVALDQDMPNLERSLDLAQQAGVLWLRQRFPWADIEPQRGVYRWETYDRIVDAAVGRGLRVIAVLDTSPTWARASNVETSPPQNNEDFGAFVAAFVSRYRGRVSHIQVWDQPNIAPHWGEFWASPSEYVALLKAAYARAKSANPDVLVLAGALAPTTADDQWNLNDVTYLRRMYAFGARGHFDVLAAKPYGFWSGPDDRRVDSATLNFSRLILLREVMEKNGDTALPIWAVEMGWNALPAAWRGQPSPWGSDSEEKQAQRLLDALRRAQTEWPWLDVMLVNGLRFPAAASNNPVRGFSLLDDSLAPRRAYLALQDLARETLVAGPGRYTPDTRTVVYSAGWSAQTGDDGSLIYRTDQAGAEFTMRFRGTDIVMYLLRQPDAGRMLVWVDDGPLSRLPRNGNGVSFVDPANLPDPGMQAHILTDDLADGEHVLRVKVISWLGHSTVTIGGYEVVRLVPPTLLYIGLAMLALVALACLVSIALLMPRLPWAAWDALVERFPPALQLAALAALVAAYYLAPWLPVAIVAAVAFAALAVTRLDLALVLTALTFPFYLYPRQIGGQVFSLPEVLTLLCFAAWLARGLGRREWGQRGNALAPALFFVLVAVVSLGASNDLRLSLRELRTVVIEPVLFYIMAAGVFDRPRRLSRWALAGALVLAGAAAAGQSLLQYFVTDEAIGAEGVVRAVGPYGSPNNLGLLLERVLPLALALAWAGYAQSPAQRRRLIHPTAFALLIAAALFLTYSIGAWLGAAVGLVVFAALRSRKQAALLLAALTLAVVVLLPVLRVERVVSHLGLTGETTSALRIDLWRSSLAMTRDHALAGVGLDGFLDAYRGVYIRPAALREPGLSHPHNLVLEWWLFLGMAGVPALVWLLVAFFRQSRQALRSLPPSQATLAQAVVAAMCAAITHGLVDRFYFGAPDLGFLFFALLALTQKVDIAHE
jgi:O-antigen ligase